MINESDVMKTETNLVNSRWLLWLVLGLLLVLGLGIGFTGKFDSIKEILKPGTPIELAEQNIVNGSEEQRFDSLMLIKNDRLKVDLEILEKVFSADNSFRVRKLALEIIMRRIELPAAKGFLGQVLPLESDPKILKIINYRLRKVTDDLSWLYKI